MSLSSSDDNCLDPIYLQNQLRIARNEINNLRQQLLSLNHVHRKECDYIYKKLDEWRCHTCKSNGSTNDRSDLPSTSVDSCDFHSNYIGTISTIFPEKRGTPRQPGIIGNTVAKLTVDGNLFTNPEHSLQGLEEFSHIWILFHFHKNESGYLKTKVAPPRLNGIRTGVFASRSPHRPCPIGLSLVKIDRIIGNVIYFGGVDMVNGTPVLDIKPYIPQYDYPGIGNINYPENNELAESVMDTMRDFSLNNGETASTSNSGVEPLLDNSDARVMDGEENGRRDITLGSSVVDNQLSRSEELFHRSTSRIGEREAPDGEEEEPPRSFQPPLESPTVSTPDGHIRVPAWIDQPPVTRLTVIFKDRALSQLAQLGAESEEKKITITNILREDPRSVYLRERWSSHCYVFRIAELYVSCKFNDNSHTVTVYQIFQNEVPPENED